MAKQAETRINMGGLKEQLNHMALETKKELAHTFTDEIKQEVINSMRDFESYRPKQYIRHGKKGFLHNSYVSAYSNPHNKKIVGGIKITADKIDPSNYFTIKCMGLKNGKRVFKRVPVGKSTAIPENSSDINQVTMGHILDLVYSGKHGNVEVFNNAARLTQGENAKIAKQPPDMKPSPYDRIYKVRDDYLKKINKHGYVSKIASKYWE